MKIVTAAVIRKDRKILVARRRAGDHLAHKWEFPGGKLEAGETPEACLKRELREEFGIESEIGKHICSSPFEYEHISIELQAYWVRHISGDFCLHSHDEIRWVDIHELANMDLAEADKPIVKKIMEVLGDDV